MSEEICRTCLMKTPLSNAFHLNDDDSFYEKIKKLASIDVSEDPKDFPKTICKKCKNKIDHFYTFRVNILQNDAKLKSDKSKDGSKIIAILEINEEIPRKEVEQTNSFNCGVCLFKTYDRSLFIDHHAEKHGSSVLLIQENQNESIKENYPKNELIQSGKSKLNTPGLSTERFIKIEKPPDKNLLTKNDYYSCTTCEFTTKIHSKILEHHIVKHNYSIMLLPSKEIEEKNELLQKKYFKGIICYICGYKARDLDKYKEHDHVVRNYSNKKDEQEEMMYECLFCLFDTNLPYELKIHQREKHGEILQNFSVEHKNLFSDNLIDYKHKCNFCGFATNNDRAFKEHLEKLRQIQNNDETNKILELINCDFCDLKFTAKATFTTHLRKEHPSALKESGILYPYNCKLCCFETCDKNLLLTHKRMFEHFKPRCETNIRKKSLQELFKDRPKYPCDLCSFEGFSRIGFERHRNKMHPNTKVKSGEIYPYKCKLCANFKTEDSLEFKKHKFKHYKERYYKAISGRKNLCFDKTTNNKTEVKLNKMNSAGLKKINSAGLNKINSTGLKQCPKCNFSTFKLSYLRKHITNMHNKCLDEQISAINCTICKKNIKLSNLNQHMRVHISGPYSCEICGKIFNSYAGCWTHRQIHVKEENVCAICGRFFQYKGKYQKHMQMHRYKKRSSQCSICGKMVSSLKKHLQTHAKKSTENKCECCNKTFRRRSILEAHIKQHKKQQPYKCSYCHKMFAYQTRYKTHMKNKHGVN